MLLLPPLRHFVTPLLKERLVWLPLRGAGNNVNCGVVYLMATNGRHYNTDIFYAFLATTPSLRDTSPQGEAFWLHLRGAVNNVN